MTIGSISDYNNAYRERVYLNKTAARAGTANVFCTLWDGTGTPAAGTLAVGNTANGLVPTSSTTGAPTITFASGTGYLTTIEFANGFNWSRARLYDRLFHAGAYAFNASVALTSQPSYAARVPGSIYSGLQIWVECVTTFTGSLSLAVTYTNQSGTTGHTTGTVVVGALTIGQMQLLPLQSGDDGVQKIESVTATVATVGTFNVIVARPLWGGSIRHESQPSLVDRDWMDALGMPQVFGTSCLAAMYSPDSAGTVDLDLDCEIASL